MHRQSVTVEPHLSGLFTYSETCLGTNPLFLNRKCLTYPKIQLSGQSVWERRCPDKWGSTVHVIIVHFVFSLLLTILIYNIPNTLNYIIACVLKHDTASIWIKITIHYLRIKTLLNQTVGMLRSIFINWFFDTLFVYKTVSSPYE